MNEIDLTPTPSMAELYAENTRLRRRVLAMTEVVGATAGLLHAIHEAGGYCVFDPRHQEPVFNAVNAASRAVAVL